MLLWEGRVGEHVGFGVVHQRGEHLNGRSQLIGDLAPLHLCRLRVLLREGGADQRRDDSVSALDGAGQRIAHEVHAAALLGGVHDLGDGGFQTRGWKRSRWIGSLFVLRFDSILCAADPYRSSPYRPSPRFRPKPQSMPPSTRATPETWRPSCFSRDGVQGTSWKPRPSSIMAKRPEASAKRCR